MHFQKVARLAETRKNVYLELVEAYSNMFSAFHLLLSDIKNNWPILIKSILDFGKEVDKTMFVCETKTKVEILRFLDVFKEAIESFHEEMVDVRELADELDSLSKEHDEIMQRFAEASNTLHKIKIEEPNSDKIESIFKYFDEQLKRSKEHIPLIVQKENELIARVKVMQPYITKLTDNLNKNILPISHLLRAELGAKTDIQLDIKAISEFNK